MRSVRAAGRYSQKKHVLGAALLSAAAVVAISSCGSGSATATAAPSAAAGGTKVGHLTVGLTYTPNIQFAPFYVADAKGFYKDAGIDVMLRHHGAAEDEFGALKSGEEDVVYAGGDEMLQARSQDLPIVDIATFYQKYPVALIIPKDSKTQKPADLKGQTIGAPGPYGETYFGLLALLKEGGLTQKDVKVKYIGFTQQAALTGNKVDGVMGYLNNDAVSFEEAGKDVRSIQLTSSGPGDSLVGVGLGAEQETLDKRGDDVRKFVAATLRGLQYAIDNPEDTVKLSEKYVPGLSDSKAQQNALAVLKATNTLMKNDQGQIGVNDPQAWSRMADFMYRQGLLKKQVAPEDAYSSDYLPK
jgi:NitT/TauT family transport system substrate-binding protein